jgi:hypothetical protein
VPFFIFMPRAKRLSGIIRHVQLTDHGTAWCLIICAGKKYFAHSNSLLEGALQVGAAVEFTALPPRPDLGGLPRGMELIVFNRTFKKEIR